MPESRKVRIYILTVLLTGILAVSCGDNRNVTKSGETNRVTLEELNASTATPGDADRDETATSGDADIIEDNTGKNEENRLPGRPSAARVFKKGTWVATRDYVTCRYWVFFGDGTMQCYDAVDGAVLHEREDEDVPGDFYSADYDQIDEELIIVSHKDGTRLEFRYISAKAEGFRFHSEEEIKKVLKAACGKNADTITIASWDYESVTFELRNSKGDQSGIYDVVRINRITGATEYSERSRNYELEW